MLLFGSNAHNRVQQLQEHMIQLGLGQYTDYLVENTPLSERQAEVLACRANGETTKETSEILDLSQDTVEDQWDEVLDQWERAQELCRIMRPHPGDDGETRQNDEVAESPWDRLSAAELNYADEDRTRIELYLYHGTSYAMGDSYLLVEKETVDTVDFAAKTTEHWSVHGVNGLRDYIYDDAETLDEYYLRWGLLEIAGINPTGDYARPPESVLDRDVSPEEAEAAKERARDRVERRTE